MINQTQPLPVPAPALKCAHSWTLSLLSIGLAGMTFWTMPAQAARDDDHDQNRPGRSLVAPPHSHAYGKSLSEWLNVYWRWNLLGQDPSKSVVNGVKLIPLPAGELVSGAGTPEDPALYRGQIEVTIDSNTPFVLPLAAWTVERYNNGTPDDSVIPNDVFLDGVSPHFTIDGKLVMSDCNETEFYVPPMPFDPIVVYAAPTSYGSYAVLKVQSIGVVGRPLSVGVHRIHLYESYILPGLFGTIFDNTWIITVKKSHHH